MIFHCMERPHFLHSSVHGHLGCFHLLAVVDMDEGRFRLLTVTASGSQKTHVFHPQERTEACEELLRIEEDAHWPSEGM